MLATGIRYRTANWDWRSEGFGLPLDVPLKIISVSYVSREGCLPRPRIWDMDVDKHVERVGGLKEEAWPGCQKANCVSDLA